MARRGISRAAIGSRRHRDHNVFALFLIEIFDAQQHPVFFQPELRFVTDGQKYGVLLIPRTDVVGHALGLQHIFLT